MAPIHAGPVTIDPCVLLARGQKRARIGTVNYHPSSVAGKKTVEACGCKQALEEPLSGSGEGSPGRREAQIS